MSVDKSVDVGLLTAALDSLDCATAVWTRDGGVVFANELARLLLGFDPTVIGHGDVVAKAGGGFFTEDGTPIPFGNRPQQRVLQGGEVIEAELLEMRLGEQSWWLRVTAKPVFHPGEEQAYAAVVSYRDVTRQRAARAALSESEAHFRLLAENAGDLIARHTVEGVCTYASPAAFDLLGRPSTALLGDWTNASVVHPDDVQQVADAHMRLLSTGESYLMHYRLQHNDGHWIWVETQARPVLGADGEVIEIQSATRDITVRLEQETRLSRMALSDALTGLPNRAALTQFLEIQLVSSRVIALLFLDLDRFKVVNDSLGHAAGDELLRLVAGRLAGTCRDGDMVTRLGGDEFVIAAPGLDEEAALQLAERVQYVLGAPMEVTGHELVMSASVGIVVSNPGQPDQRAEDLLRDADVSMYRAKERGRARAVVWTEELGANAVRRLGLESELRAALERGELVVYYQPQVELATSRITGLEALVRWDHPEKGLLAPSEFLDAADQSGLIVELGRQVLTSGLTELARWRAVPGYEELELCVNVSAQELLNADRFEQTTQLLLSHQLPASALTIEVLESVLFDSEGAVQHALMAYVEAGIQLALDDFGTGSSSLVHLRQVPFTTLKIDRAFVAGVGTSARDEAIVRALRSLTDDLGLGCIAEGVEVESQRTWLTAQGIRVAQGFLLHRPQSAADMSALLMQPDG
ncbi:MAG: EAL domain-containing protein [Mycobacteriales bacterium]